MKKIALVLICTLALWPIMAHSEPGQMKSADPGKGPQGMMNSPIMAPGRPMMGPRDGKFHERMAAVRFYKLIEFLDLTTEEANKLAPAVQALDAGRRDFFQSRDKALDNLAELVRKGTSGNELKKAVAGIEAVDNTYREKEQAATRKVLDLLPPEKQAKYYLFNRYFDHEVRQGLYNMAEQRMKGKAKPGAQPPLPPKEM